MLVKELRLSHVGIIENRYNNDVTLPKVMISIDILIYIDKPNTVYTLYDTLCWCI